MMLLPLVISLSAKTSVFGQDFTPETAKTIRLKKDFPAPFTGQLMTDEVYRFYVNTRDACFITENALGACQREIQESQGASGVIWFLGGVILGGALGLSMVKR